MKKFNRLKKLFSNKKAYVTFFFLLFLLVCIFGLYVYSPMGRAVRPFLKSIPYPVAFVGGWRETISSRELFINADAVRQFYESQDYSELGLRVDFDTKLGRVRLRIKEKEVLDKLIENKLTEQIANKKGIYLTITAANKELNKKIKEVGDRESLKMTLKSLYGWGLEDFRDNVIIYQMYLKELFDIYAAEAPERTGYKKIAKAAKELKDDASNFAQLAKKYSDGESAQNSGELGWFDQEKMIPEVAEKAFKMEAGQVSDVIVSPLGFHIVQVQEIKDETSEQPKQVKIRQIFTEDQSFGQWFIEEKKKIKVVVLMQEYEWDQEEARIKFRDDTMEQIEEKIRLKSEGDPSLMNFGL